MLGLARQYKPPKDPISKHPEKTWRKKTTLRRLIYVIGTLVVDLNGLMDANDEKDLNQPVSVLHLAKN